ncbi:NUDIX hydrolase [Loigolactobacillus backii]|uniref:NUDIX hydrolase n=2 Tax=Loigolactobacillus backii TaxID=375175 RepID=A0A192H1T7_9LACO|nr:NUDIX hydrolase [Loigolactobacillus backii]ANK62202.1 NUDIX hydrolase [Loigolactobacillus backii]ANK65236.1 NUDIX hydrolase [Loigolactobacillus backii]ANK67795.1 NUDIX hydrolase [Loigolactobacillus backii]ANK70783.1 NUDIX hydrolase [Loigolactobacillus backii]
MRGLKMTVKIGRQGNILAEKVLYVGPIFSLVQQKIKTPDDLTIQRDVVQHRPAVAMLAMTSDQQVLINVEYRAGTNSENIALPAGLINPGEDVLAAAKRELQEETGYVATNLREMTTVTSSEGFTDEKVTLILADISREMLAAKHFDQDEFVNSQLMPFTKVKELVQQGVIHSAQTVSAIGYYLAFMQK